MRFGPVAVADAVGAIAAHTVRAGDLVVKKGTPITAELVAALAEAGLTEIVVARLEPGDVSEDEAAARLAALAAGAHVRAEPAFTGRSNLFAEAAGVLVVADDQVRNVNAFDEAITLATLPAFAPVEAGTMVGTVKIIPYGVDGGLLAKAAASAASAVRIAPYRLTRAGYVATVTPALKPSVIAKTQTLTERRLAGVGARIAASETVAHDSGPLVAALRRQAEADSEFIIVFGATAIADRRDVVPAAIEAAGGRVDHLGMPVDPGNLLLVGTLAGKPVIGAPGCARSPKENGFDWVLRRVVAGLPVTRAVLVAMGVGGLLMEIGTRPQPRLGRDNEAASVEAGDG